MSTRNAKSAMARICHTVSDRSHSFQGEHERAAEGQLLWLTTISRQLPPEGKHNPTKKVKQRVDGQQPSKRHVCHIMKDVTSNKLLAATETTVLYPESGSCARPWHASLEQALADLDYTTQRATRIHESIGPDQQETTQNR